MKRRIPIDQMGGAGQQPPPTIAGHPADTCPYCGCTMFCDGTNRTAHDVVRYVQCRNSACARRFISRQAPAKLVRELDPPGD
jgi:hypothetical protein